jgi:hypothetical protein
MPPNMGLASYLGLRCENGKNAVNAAYPKAFKELKAERIMQILLNCGSMFRAPGNLTYDLELAAQPHLLRGSETGRQIFVE